MKTSPITVPVHSAGATARGRSAGAAPSTEPHSVSARPGSRLRALGLALLPALLVGCTATKSTVYFAKAEQSLYQARVLDAETWAPYMWTRANETMKKSREEWAYSDFGAAEQLAIEASELAERAVERAQQNKATGIVPGKMRELPTAPGSMVAPPADPNAVDQSPGAAPTGVDQSPGAAPTGVDQSPGAQPSGVDQSPGSAPSGVDQSPGAESPPKDTTPTPWGG